MFSNTQSKPGGTVLPNGQSSAGVPEEHWIRTYHHPSYITPQQQEEIRSICMKFSGAVIVRASGRRSSGLAVQSATALVQCVISRNKIAAITAAWEIKNV